MIVKFCYESLENKIYYHGIGVSNPFNATTNWEAHTNSFVAQSDGWLYLLVGLATDQTCQLAIDNVVVFYEGCTIYAQNTCWTSRNIFIKKGQNVVFQCKGNCYIANSVFLKL